MPSPSPHYEWTLCYSPSNSAPFAPLARIGTLDGSKNRQFNPVRNRAGSAQFTIRTEHPMAYAILDQVDYGDVRGTVRKCITIQRDGKMLWSGPIWGISGSLNQDQITVSCVGWLEELQHVVLEHVADYSNDGHGTRSDFIVFDLLARANAQEPARPLRIQPGTVYGDFSDPTRNPNRNRYYDFGQNLGAAIQELSDIEAGYDYTIEPITRSLDLYTWNQFTTRTDVVLGYNWGPNNLKDFGWQESTDKTCNKMFVKSLGQPVGPLVDELSLDRYGVFEEWNTISGANQGILAAYGEAELAVRSNPILTFNVVPQQHSGKSERPSLFDDYDIGDAIFVSAQKGAFKLIRQKIRVFGASISLDDNGNETVTQLQLSPTA